MSYKTILVHLNDPRRAEAVLEPAVRLANTAKAHLIGLHVYPGASLAPLGIPYSAPILESIAAAERKQTDGIAAAFARMTANQPFTSERRGLKVAHADLAPTVIEHGRTADLIVAGQADPDWELSALMDFPERIVLESGRPLLAVPYAGRYPTIGSNVVIAWKSGREAARATFDALPLLTAAETVQVLEVKEHGDDSATLTADTSIAAALSRHGIAPTIRTSVGSDIAVGDEILSRIADMGADLLVMGAYGHSRMRETVFGGATRHIFRHMTVPTLFSH